MVQNNMNLLFLEMESNQTRIPTPENNSGLGLHKPDSWCYLYQLYCFNIQYYLIDTLKN